MCGICGIVSSAGAPVDREVLTRMRDAMTHRGPDDAGLYLDECAGLGHRRLSIIDLATGQQPMTMAGENAWIVFNGEIYNYLELRRDHLAGRQFATTSDTEVILQLYDRYGDDCVQYLNGMFAFAIWDKARRRLLLARDRVGVKPLYYAERSGRLLFASEIKALIEDPAVQVNPDPAAVDEFMTYGYSQGSRTMFKDVHRLLPGQRLVWERGRVTLDRYWTLRFDSPSAASEDEHVAQVRSLLTDSVKLRQRSDVPFGVLLSGGLDSSIVAALLARAVGKIQTFSIGFDAGRDYNELPYARAMARHVGSDHHEMLLTPGQFRDSVPGFVHQMDEPVTEAAAIPLYHVCRLASANVKVVLCGEGADELFAGNPIYPRMRLIDRYGRLPRTLRKWIIEPAARSFLRDARLDKYLRIADLPVASRYLNVHLYDRQLRDSLYTDSFRHRISNHDALQLAEQLYRQAPATDDLGRMLHMDTTSWLPNDLLIKADRMSMAASIELRVPFLDYRLVEYAAAMPSRFKLRRGRSKHVLRRATADLVLPETVRRGKMGFPTPLTSLFRTALREYATELLCSSSAHQRGYFEPAVVTRMLEEHMGGRRDHADVLWRLVVLEEWHRQFADVRSSERPTTQLAASTREIA